MKKKALLFILPILFCIQSYAQTGVAINTTGNDPDNTALLDVSSTEKGILIPRMTQAQRTAIASPVKGLMVYQTETPEGFYFFDGTSWNHLSSATGTAPGQMQYWNGSAWVTVPAGQTGQILTFVNGIPTWMNDYSVNNLDIGDYYQGGIIAYFLQPGDPGYDANVRHGLIAAPTDFSTITQWGCYGTSITGADGTALGTGPQNTLDVVNGCSTAGIAARLCDNLELNGYSDWYLPSKDEINKLYLNQTAIGGFAAATYWSSSESSSYDAWDQSFGGYQYANLKSTFLRVRAVRAF